MQRTKKSDFFSSFLATGLNLGIGIITLPFVLKFLSQNQIGMWFVFMGFSGLANLIDAALSPSIARNMSYAWVGAQSIEKIGINTNNKSDAPNYDLIKSIVKASETIYYKVSILVFVSIGILGGGYVLYVAKNLNKGEVIISWILFAFAMFVNLRYNSWVSLLRGIGGIKEGQNAIIISKISQLILMIIGLLLYKSLIILSITFLLSGLVLRIIVVYQFRNKINTNLTKYFNSDKYPIHQTIETIWHNAKQIFVWSIGNFVIMQFGIFFVAYYINLAISANYGITLQLFTILSGISTTVGYVYVPELNRLVILEEWSSIVKKVKSSILLSTFFFLSGAMIIYFFAEPLLKFFGSKAHVLKKDMLVAVSLIFILEMIHSLCSVFITIFNFVPFAKSAVLSALLVIMLTFIFYYLNFGLWSVFLARGVIQLGYNNWKWPYDLFHLLKAKNAKSNTEILPQISK